MKPSHLDRLDRLDTSTVSDALDFLKLPGATVGLPPIQYLAQWRATEARRLLKNRRFSVAAVAEMLGYRSEAAFRRFFKRIEGIGPGKARSSGSDDDAG